VKENSIDQCQKGDEHHHNGSNNAKNSCCSSVLLEMFADHYETIGISKVSYRPDEEPHKSYETQYIKNDGGSFPTKHDLVGQNE
jgi:hypothetical protein